MNKITLVCKFSIRTIILFIPAIILLAGGILGLVSTGLRNLWHWVFNSESYWDIQNEWYQFIQDYKKWHKFWIHGAQKGDW